MNPVLVNGDGRVNVHEGAVVLGEDCPPCGCGGGMSTGNFCCNEETALAFPALFDQQGQPAPPDFQVLVTCNFEARRQNQTINFPEESLPPGTDGFYSWGETRTWSDAVFTTISACNSGEIRVGPGPLDSLSVYLQPSFFLRDFASGLQSTNPGLPFWDISSLDYRRVSPVAIDWRSTHFAQTPTYPVFFVPNGAPETTLDIPLFRYVPGLRYGKDYPDSPEFNLDIVGGQNGSAVFGCPCPQVPSLAWDSLFGYFVEDRVLAEGYGAPASYPNGGVCAACGGGGSLNDLVSRTNWLRPEASTFNTNSDLFSPPSGVGVLLGRRANGVPVNNFDHSISGVTSSATITATGGPDPFGTISLEAETVYRRALAIPTEIQELTPGNWTITREDRATLQQRYAVSAEIQVFLAPPGGQESYRSFVRCPAYAEIVAEACAGDVAQGPCCDQQGTVCGRLDDNFPLVHVIEHPNSDDHPTPQSGGFSPVERIVMPPDPVPGGPDEPPRVIVEPLVLEHAALVNLAPNLLSYDADIPDADECRLPRDGMDPPVGVIRGVRYSGAWIGQNSPGAPLRPDEQFLVTFNERQIVETYANSPTDNDGRGFRVLWQIDSSMEPQFIADGPPIPQGDFGFSRFLARIVFDYDKTQPPGSRISVVTSPATQTRLQGAGVATGDMEQDELDPNWPAYVAANLRETDLSPGPCAVETRFRFLSAYETTGRAFEGVPGGTPTPVATVAPDIFVRLKNLAECASGARGCADCGEEFGL